jgi:hypothetical protein
MFYNLWMFKLVFLNLWIDTAVKRLIIEWQDNATLHKGDFIPMCKRAWEKGISQKNIKAAWEKCGIHPFNRQRVLTNPHRHLTETPNPHRRVGLRNLPGRRPAPASEIQMLAAAEPSTLEKANYAD